MCCVCPRHCNVMHQSGLRLLFCPFMSTLVILLFSCLLSVIPSMYWINYRVFIDISFARKERFQVKKWIWYNNVGFFIKLNLVKRASSSLYWIHWGSKWVDLIYWHHQLLAELVQNGSSLDLLWINPVRPFREKDGEC